MCDHRIIGSVKQNMLDRRKFVQYMAPALVAIPFLAGCGENEPRTMVTDNKKEKKYYDLTHTLTEDFPTFLGEQNFFLEPKFTWEEHKFILNVLRIDEHTGTHMDAPLHFSNDGLSVDEITVDNLIVPLVVIDIKAKAQQNPDAQVTPEDVNEWVEKNGELPDKCCVVMNSGWGQHVRNAKFRNVDQQGIMHFPGFHEDTAAMLLEEYNVAGIGVDTLSLDYGASQNFATHNAWLPKNKWGIECLANLDAVPEKGGILIVGAPKHAGGSGGPCRVFCMV